MDFSDTTWNYYYNYLDENILYTDNTITPISNKTKLTSFSSQPFKTRAKI